jgi:flagellar basal body-associated protein FliL
MNAKHVEHVNQLLNSTSILWIGLGIAIVLLALAVHRIRAWYRDGDDPAAEAEEIVRQMQDLNRQGGLTDEEFRSIKSQFSGSRDG